MVFWVYFVLNNLRESLRPALEKMGKGFAATGLSPNFWTVVGLVIALASAAVYGMGMEFGLIIGGILLLVSGFFDMVDGQVARVTGKTSKKGEYLDSMFDKISEVAIFLGILVGGYAEPYLVLLAITLSLLVSYAVIIVVIIAGITLIQRMIYTAKNIKE
jgi:archaetidylinositol phosphate synthase